MLQIPVSPEILYCIYAAEVQDSSSIPPSPEGVPSQEHSRDRLPDSSQGPQRTPLASKAPQQQQQQLPAFPATEASTRRESPAATYYSEVRCLHSCTCKPGSCFDA